MGIPAVGSTSPRTSMSPSLSRRCHLQMPPSYAPSYRKLISAKHRNVLHRIPFHYKGCFITTTAPVHSPPPSLGRRTLRCGTMGRRRDKTSALFTRLAHGLSRKRWSAVFPLSTSLGLPTHQTSLSACPCVSSPDDQVLTCLILPS